MRNNDDQRLHFPITTTRLALRPLDPADADDLFEYHSLEEVVFFTPWPIRSRLDVTAYIEKVAGMQSSGLDADGATMVLAWQHRALSKVVGQSNISMEDRAQGVVEIGYASNPVFQRQGLAHEATTALLQFAFSHAFVHTVVAKIDSRADRSIRLAEKLGFRELPNGATQIEQKGEKRTLLHFELSRDSFAAKES